MQKVIKVIVGTSGERKAKNEGDGSHNQVSKAPSTTSFANIVPATATAAVITTPTATATAAITTNAVAAHNKKLLSAPIHQSKGNPQRGSSTVLDNNNYEGNQANGYGANDWLRPMSDFYRNPARPVVNVAIIGNPGVGKSAILNALGGEFGSGFSKVSGFTKDVSKKIVDINHNHNHIKLQLFDIPGIDDCAVDGKDTIVKHLQMVEDALNEEGPFVIFFVIKPLNGRINTGDYVVMKTVLDSLREAPQVGLILTHARLDDVFRYRAPQYTRTLFAPLVKIVDTKSKKFLSKDQPLVLAEHDANGFSADDKIDILNFVLSFDPMPVVSRNMVAQAVRRFFEAMTMAI